MHVHMHMFTCTLCLRALIVGNSGGPVVNSINQVIGVAFQSLSDEDIENIGSLLLLLHLFIQP